MCACPQPEDLQETPDYHLCSVWQLRMHSERRQDPVQQNCNHLTEIVENFRQWHSKPENENNTIPNISKKPLYYYGIA
jgi:hypothetical protein